MKALGKLLTGVCIGAAVFMTVPALDGTGRVSAAYDVMPYDGSEYVYLSDIPTSNGNIPTVDLNGSGSTMLLNIGGSKQSFTKGVSAYASSEFVYDLSQLDRDYNTFKAWLGIDARQTSDYFNNGAIAYVYTSTDGNNWVEKYKSPKSIYGWDEAIELNIDITNAKYLKISSNCQGNNWWSAWYDDVIFADAKLVVEGYEDSHTASPDIKTMKEYDELIKKNPNNEHLVLQRQFVNAVGYDALLGLANYSTGYREIIKWLMDDQYNLELYLYGGRPDGSYSRSLQVLYLLKEKYGNDLNDEKNGDLYRRMMITLSLTHAKNVGSWVGGAGSDPDAPNSSNALKRYEIYKKLHSENRLDKVFDDLLVSEMRFVFDAKIDDESIDWLNWYVTNRKGGDRNPYMYIEYKFGYDYSLPQYYDPDQKQKWINKYNIQEYGLSYEQGYPKLWTVWEEGSVCGGLSETGTNLNEVFGVPAALVGQPAHAAYIAMGFDKKTGRKIWNIGNDITGWSRSEKSGFLFNWGDGDYPKPQYYTAYQLLGQQAVEDYENYKKAEQKVMLANSYLDDFERAKEFYDEAIQIQNFNLDAWLGLVNLYGKNTYANDNMRIELATRIADNLTYHPIAVNDLINLLKSFMSSPASELTLNGILNAALTKATHATEDDVLQPGAAHSVALWLLGKEDTTIATFSFTGEKAGKIVISDKIGENQWEYSVDGRVNWTTVNGSMEAVLTPEELDTINDEMDIAIRLYGIDTVHMVEIEKEMMPENTVYANDLENRFTGVVDYLEWKKEDSEDWIKFEERVPELTGNTSVQVRKGRNGNRVASDPVTYEFTEDSSDNTHKYVSVDNIKVNYFSSQEAEMNMYASMSVDGNIYTKWQSNRATTSSDRVIILELEDAVFLSALEYVPRVDDSNTGLAKNIRISVSTSGSRIDDFAGKEVVTATDWKNDKTVKRVEFEPTLAKYIKIEATEVYDKKHFSAAMFNLFEDATKVVPPVAGIEYSGFPGWTTSEPVTATLVNESRPITITNNNGERTYTFTESGEFTFEFVDEKGIKGSATAVVDWINTEVADIIVECSTTERTDEPVIITIREKSGMGIWCSSEENDELVDNGGDSMFTLPQGVELGEEGFATAWQYTFEYNDTLEFYYVTEAYGGDNYTIKVDWIDRIPPVGEIVYSPKAATNQNVEATLNVNSKYYTLIDDTNTHTFTENGTYIFECYSEKYDVTGTIEAKVDWIDRIAPEVAVKYTEIPDARVKTIRAEVYSVGDEAIKATNNGGFLYRDFDAPGTYEFVVSDQAGNEVKITADVTSYFMEQEEPGESEESGEETGGSETGDTVEETGGSDIGEAGTEEGGEGQETESTGGSEEAVEGDGEAEAQEDIQIVVEYSTREATDQPVTITIKDTYGNEIHCSSKENDGRVHNGKESLFKSKNNTEFASEWQYTFEYNDTLEAYYITKDKKRKEFTVDVNWINRIPPAGEVLYSTKEPTNQNVEIMLDVNSKYYTLKNDSNRYTFTENGTYIFECYSEKFDRTENVEVKVDWIDRTAPEVAVKYTELDNQQTKTIRAEVYSTDGEAIKVLNNDGRIQVDFTEAGTFEFSVSDLAGNITTITADSTDYFNEEDKAAADEEDEAQTDDEEIWEESRDEEEEPSFDDIEEIDEEDRKKYEINATEDIPEGIWISEIKAEPYTGKAVTPEVRVYWRNKKLVKNTDYTVSYKNNVKAGTASVTIKGKGKYTGTITENYTINPLDIVDAALLNDVVVLKYTGKAQKATNTLTYMLNGKKITLKNGTDFTYSYYKEDNEVVPQESGEYTVKLTGKGNYSGVKTFTERITDSTLINKLSISLGNVEYPFGAGMKQIKPGKVTITDKTKKPAVVFTEDEENNGVLFVESREKAFKIIEAANGESPYSIVYYCENNYDYGTATAVFLGVPAKGYDGIVKKTYKITGRPLGKAVFAKELTAARRWTDSEIEPVELIGADAVKYLVNKVEVAAFRGVKLSKAEYDALEENEKTQYDEYSYIYEYVGDTSSVGTVKIVFTGINGYYGTVTKSYKITGTAISSAKVDWGDKGSVFTYDGEAVEPAGSPSDTNGDESGESAPYDGFRVYVVDKATGEETELEKDADYEVSYTNNNKAGTATLVIKGIKGYTGTKKVSFKINRLALSEDRFSILGSDGNPVDGKSYPYTKGGVKPEIGVYDNERQTYIKAGTDYTVKYSNNNAVGQTAKLPTITVTGKGSYSGTLKAGFEIEKQKMSAVNISAGDVVYAPKAGKCKPALTILDTNGQKLTAGTDYEKEVKYTYAINTKVLNAYTKEEEDRYVGDPVDPKKDIIREDTKIKATITGRNNYVGEKSAFFRFVSSDISKATVKIPTQYYNQGKAVRPSGLTVTLGKNLLTEGVDYKIINYSNNRNVGTAYVTIRGLKAYGGTKKVNFKIASKNMMYTIEYDSNNAYMKDAPRVSTIMNGSNVAENSKLAVNTFKREGYVFDGWNTEPDGEGGVEFKNGEVLTAEKLNECRESTCLQRLITYGDNIRLYAQWIPIAE